MDRKEIIKMLNDKRDELIEQFNDYNKDIYSRDSLVNIINDDDIEKEYKFDNEDNLTFIKINFLNLLIPICLLDDVVIKKEKINNEIIVDVIDKYINLILKKLRKKIKNLDKDLEKINSKLLNFEYLSEVLKNEIDNTNSLFLKNILKDEIINIFHFYHY